MSVMTVIPTLFHSFICLSKSNMFVAPRYIAGFNSWSWAYWIICLIGDGRALPDANQFSESITQKSGSVWHMIACGPDIIMSSMI